MISTSFKVFFSLVVFLLKNFFQVIGGISSLYCTSSVTEVNNLREGTAQFIEKEDSRFPNTPRRTGERRVEVLNTTRGLSEVYRSRVIHPSIKTETHSGRQWGPTRNDKPSEGPSNASLFVFSLSGPYLQNPSLPGTNTLFEISKQRHI